MATVRGAPKSPQACRMSWFLMEMDEGHARGNIANGNCFYGIVHAIDIFDEHSSDMYIDRRVRFCWKRVIMDGRIVMAADDISQVQQHMEILLKEQKHKAMLQQQINRKYLVQYAKDGYTIVHAVMHQKDVAGIITARVVDDVQDSKISEVMIQYGQNKRLAKVLHTSEAEDALEQELDILKNKCFYRSFINANDNSPLDLTPWLLVQFSTGPCTVNYSIANIHDTVCQAENLYPHVVAYLKEGETVYQAIIIRKSRDLNELQNELTRIMDFSGSANFPLRETTCMAVSSATLHQQSFVAESAPHKMCSNSKKNTNRSYKCLQLEQIEEQSECGSLNSIASLNREMKLCKAATDIKRLDGGCMKFKTKSKESILDEEIKIPEPNNRITRNESSVTCHTSPSRDRDEGKLNSITPNSVRQTRGDHKLDIDSKCDQIERLEEQITQMNIDLNHIRQRMVPHEDIAKFSSLSKHFNEINSLLTELKFNCLKLQETANSNIQEDQMPCRRNSKMKETVVKNRQFQSNCYSNDEKDFANDRFACTKSQIRRCRRRQRCNPADCNNIPQNFCSTQRKYTEPKHREWCVSADDVISDIEYINRESQDECLNDPNLSRMCEKRCRSQTTFQRDRHDSPTPSLTTSSSGTDLEQFNTIVESESQTSSTKCFYSPAENNEPYICRARRNKTCKTHNINERNGAPKHLYRRSFSTPEYRRTLAKDIRKMYISNTQDEQSKLRSEASRSSTKCQQTTFPEQYEASRTSSKRYRQMHTNLSENCKYQQYTKINAVGSNESMVCTANSSTKSSTNFHNTKRPVVKKNLVDTIFDVVKNNDPNDIALTVILKSNSLYQINISVTHTGQSLADVYTTETALREAERQHLFERFLTFFVLNSNFTLEQKNTILGHSFQFINTEPCQIFNFKSNNNQLGNNHRLKSRFIKLQSEDNKLQLRTGISNFKNVSENCAATVNKRVKGGNSNKDLEEPSVSKNLKGPFTCTGQYIDMSNNSYNPSEEKSVRIRNLEIQVQRLRQELSHMREELVPQEDIIKFSNLSERLRELNELLRDLRSNYQKMNDPERENTEENSKYEKNIFEQDEQRDNFDEFKNVTERESTVHQKIQKMKEPKQSVTKIDALKVNGSVKKYNTPQNLSHAQECDKSHNPEDNYAPPTSPECKKFFNDIKNPRNLFEKHLLMMKDFRTDADLRRQRIERKRREKIEQRQHKLEEETKETKNERSKSNIEDEWKFVIKHVPATKDKTNEYSWGDNTGSQPQNYMETVKGNCNIPQTSAKDTRSVKTVTRDTQTCAFFSPHSNTEFRRNKYYEPQRIFDSESDTTPPSESVYSVSQASHENISQSPLNVPIIQSNLSGVLHDILRQYKQKHSSTGLTISMESDDIYHINIWTTISAKSLGYLYATEVAIQEAEDQSIFTTFLTYIVVSEKNTLEQKHRLLGHSFEIIKADK